MNEVLEALLKRQQSFDEELSEGASSPLNLADIYRTHIQSTIELLYYIYEKFKERIDRGYNKLNEAGVFEDYLKKHAEAIKKNDPYPEAPVEIDLTIHEALSKLTAPRKKETLYLLYETTKLEEIPGKYLVQLAALTLFYEDMASCSDDELIQLLPVLLKAEEVVRAFTARHGVEANSDMLCDREITTLKKTRVPHQKARIRKEQQIKDIKKAFYFMKENGVEISNNLPIGKIALKVEGAFAKLKIADCCPARDTLKARIREIFKEKTPEEYMDSLINRK